MHRTQENRKLSELKRTIVLTKLSSGQSVASVARELNISARHIHDWIKTDQGVQLIENSLQESREILESRLPSLVEKSLNSLDDALSCPFMSDSKMAAARTILQTISRLSKNQNPCPECAKRVIDIQ